MTNILGGNIGKWSDYNSIETVPITITENINNNDIKFSCTKKKQFNFYSC